MTPSTFHNVICGCGLGHDKNELSQTIKMNRWGDTQGGTLFEGGIVRCKQNPTLELMIIDL